MGDREGYVPAVCLMIFVGFFSGLVSCHQGQQWGRDKSRSKLLDEAVKAGVGEYYLDADHNKQFRWKQQKASEE